MIGLLLAATLVAPPRFFVMGDGRLALVNAHTKASVDVRYRRQDGSYDDEALAQIRRAFRSEGDTGEGRASLRLIEILSQLQQNTKVRPLTLMSGYRSPVYNEDLRAKGIRAAGGSLHTEGLAADVAFPRPMLKGLWLKLRAMDCCGAGYYAKDGFLHVDVGRPRFWEPTTSRVEENLSAGNARAFARTEFDRYARDEPIRVTLHSITEPPISVAVEARLAREDGDPLPVRLMGEHVDRDGCVKLETSSAVVSLAGVSRPAHGTITLSTCEPRAARTPPLVEANRIEVR
jgi:uncharacterized protein YcbK (DUF882 family)